MKLENKYQHLVSYMAMNAGKTLHRWRRDMNRQGCSYTDGYWVWTEHTGNKEALAKIWKGHILLTIQKKPLKLLKHIIRKEGLANLTLIGHSEGKRSRGKEQVTYLMKLCEWMAE